MRITLLFAIVPALLVGCTVPHERRTDTRVFDDPALGIHFEYPDDFSPPRRCERETGSPVWEICSPNLARSRIGLIIEAYDNVPYRFSSLVDDVYVYYPTADRWLAEPYGPWAAMGPKPYEPIRLPVAGREGYRLYAGDATGADHMVLVPDQANGRYVTLHFLYGCTGAAGEPCTERGGPDEDLILSSLRLNTPAG